MSNDLLMINLEAMQTAQTSYNDCALRMETLRNKVKVSVEDIRSSWQSDAGDAFFKKFDDEWLKNFNDYVDVIKHMSENMVESKKRYQQVFDEADIIKLHN